MYPRTATSNAAPTPTTLLEEYEKARLDFFQACEDFNSTQQRRNAASQRVSELAEKAMQYITEGTEDPTVPKAAVPNHLPAIAKY